MHVANFERVIFVPSEHSIMTFGAITIDPDILSGVPVFTGTRVPLKTLFDYFEGGDQLDEFLNDYPSVKREQAIEALGFAVRAMSDKNVLNALAA